MKTIKSPKCLLSILLVLTITLTLLYTTALAAEYHGWDDSKPYSDGDTITIDGKSYTYKGDMSASMLDLAPYTSSGWKPLTGNLVYKAGSGYILYSYGGSTAAVTLHNATSSGFINLPFSRGPAALDQPTACDTTVTLEGSSTLTNNLIHTAGATTFTGSGSLTADCTCELSGDVTVTGGAQLTLEGNSAYVNGFLSVHNGGITVTAGTVLYSGNSTNSTAYPGGITVNDGTLENEGTIRMTTKTAAAPGITGNITGSGLVKFGEDDTPYIKAGTEWIVYGGDISTKALAIASDQPATIYRAGSGTVIWDPTVIPATLTFDGATIEVASPSSTPVVAVTVPWSKGPVNVIFKGINSITANSEFKAAVFESQDDTTFTLTTGSDTTLIATSMSGITYGIDFNTPNSADTLIITGSGRLAIRSEGGFSAFAIDTYSGYSFYHSVEFNGGTLAFSGEVTADVTLGGVTVPSGNKLFLDKANNVTKGAAGAVINGELHLPDSTTPLESVNGLGLTGNGIVVVGNDKKFIYVDSEWVAYDSKNFYDGLDISGPPSSSTPTVKTAYRAGNGTVVWNPTMSGDPAAVTGGTLTLNGAQITLGNTSTANFFKLPNVPVTIELKGTSTLNTSDGGVGTGTVPNTANFFTSSHSVELTGSGSINSTTSGYFINTINSVTLNGGTHSGKMKAGSVMLNSLTIPENGELNLQDVTGDVTATNVVNNGTLVLKRKTDTNADIAAIKALHLTGSGIVKATNGTSNYYTNGGTLISNIGGTMDFSKAPADGNWSEAATVEENGYAFSGDAVNGYTLALGDLIMDENGPLSVITLPGDGSVTVVLADGTTTRISNGSDDCAMLFKTGSVAYPCTITGKGKLLLQGSLRTMQPLTIAGGDITIKNGSSTGVGIDANGTKLTVSGSSIRITTKNAALKASGFTLNNMAITSPTGAAFDSDKQTICDANGNAVSSVAIEAAVVATVTVSPTTASVVKGDRHAFTASVTGTNSPAQTVNWTVEGGVTGTTIDPSGNLMVAANETASSLIIRATSTVDAAKSGTATVTLITPVPTEYKIIQGANGEWIKGNTNGLIITVDADISSFIGVSVDSVALLNDQYTAKSGSTVVTLKTSYLETLSAGRHTLRMSFMNGYAETHFTVNPTPSPIIPVTGDNAQPLLWVGIALLAGAGLAAGLILGRKKR